MAIARNDVYISAPSHLFKSDLTRWGWIQLILGVIATGVSVGLFSRARWARVVGAGIAGLLLIADFLVDPVPPPGVTHPDRAVRPRHPGPVRRAGVRARGPARRPRRGREDVLVALLAGAQRGPALLRPLRRAGTPARQHRRPRSLPRPAGVACRASVASRQVG
ncbi:DUF7144 family membrane protein [Streptomyces incanus]